MTRQQAINYLRSSGMSKEQIDTVVDALNPKGDLISRQVALDAFGLTEKTRKYGGDHSGYDTRMLYEIQIVLESLPSAQQWIPCSERLPDTSDWSAHF